MEQSLNSLYIKKQETQIDYIYINQIPTQQRKINQIKKSSSRGKKEELKKLKKKGTARNWSIPQNKKYLNFLKESGQLLELQIPTRKKLKVNVIMSKKIHSRSPVQCHSHHQKMVKKFGSTQGIISAFQKKFASKNTKKIPNPIKTNIIKCPQLKQQEGCQPAGENKSQFVVKKEQKQEEQIKILKQQSANEYYYISYIQSARS